MMTTCGGSVVCFEPTLARNYLAAGFIPRRTESGHRSAPGLSVGGSACGATLRIRTRYAAAAYQIAESR